MRFRTFVLRWAAVVVLGCSAAAQETPSDSGTREANPCDGFWPTPKMLDHMMDRISDDMADTYDLDDGQADSARKVLKNRLIPWLQENRSRIQPLMNQFFEATLAGEPPEPEMVAEWSRQIMPLMEEFGQLGNTIGEEFRTFMNDDQQLRLDGQMAAFHAALGFVGNKVGLWAEGGYDPEVDWTADRAERRQRDREERRKMREEMELARQEATDGALADAASAPGGAAAVPPPGQPASTPAAPKPTDEWDVYVDAFVKKYSLNAEQTAKARVFLADRKEQRERYWKRQSAAMQRITKLYRDAKPGDDSFAKAEAEYAKLKEPVDKLFAELKDKLETLPSRDQRRKAESASAAAPGAAAPATP